MLTEAQNLNIKRHAQGALRKLKVRCLDDFEPHKLDWSALNKAENALAAEARSIVDRIGDDTPEAEARALNDAADVLLDVLKEIDSEKDERTERGDRGPRKVSNPRRPVSDGGEHPGVDDGFENRHNSGADDALGSFALRPEQRYVDYLRDNGRGRDYRGLKLGAYLRAMVRGPQNDLERRALAGGTDSAGGYTVPDALSGAIIDLLRSRSVVFQTGALTVPLTSATNTIAKIASDPVPGWRAENAAIAESDPTFGAVVMQPKSLAVLVKVPRELLDDSVNINTALPMVLVSALAAEVDRVALLGSGSGSEPEGIVNFSALTSNAFAGGALDSYVPLIQARTALRTANSDCTGFVMSTRDEGTLAELADSTGQPLQLPPALRDIPMLSTSKMPVDGGAGSNESQIIAGDWSRLLVGIRSDIRVEVLRETFAANHQYAFVAHMRADIGCEYEAAFTVLDAITPAA